MDPSSHGDSRALVAINDQRIPCPECDAVLPSPRALFEHKQEMMKTRRGHMNCVKCRTTFHTPEGYNLHYRLSHIAQQKLECPACKVTFVKASGLVQHLENGACERLGDSAKAYTNVKREQTINFIRALQAKDLAAHAGYQIGPGKPADDYGGYIGKGKNDYELTEDEAIRLRLIQLNEEYSEDKGASFNREIDFPHPGTQGYHHGDSKQPDLLSEENPVIHNQPDKGAWEAGSKQLFPNALPGARPTAEELLRILEQVDKKMPREEHDPDASGFNVARYWVEVLGKFKCPHLRCGKSFKAATGLAGHLRSGPHKSTLFICPQCMRKFRSITALAQHAEAEGMHCTVQKSESYRMFLMQLTGAVIDVKGTHDDRSLKYVVTEQAQRDLSDGVEGVLKVLTASKDTQQAPQPTLAAAAPKLLTARDHHEKFCEDYRREMAEKHGARVGHATADQW